MLPLHIRAQCVSGDEQLFANIREALKQGLPEVRKMESPHQSAIAIVGSGPSAETQLDTIRAMQKANVAIVGVRDGLNYLIANGIVPDYALNVDPLESATTCFENPHPGVQYYMASQSHPRMWDVLRGTRLTLWHAFCRQEPHPNKPDVDMWIAGSTTSGLRAVCLFYVLGFRTFHLFGLDSCLSKDGRLRITGDKPKEGDAIVEVRVEENGEAFATTASMAHQAYTFQDFYKYMGDCVIRGYGRGLIQAIIRKREETAVELDAISSEPDNGMVSFIHSWDSKSASYRYRAAIPAQQLGASLNDKTASTLVFSKPQAAELMDMARAKMRGGKIIVDFCDNHFELMHYKEALRLADAIVCPTEEMAKIIKDGGYEAAVIPDPYEFDLRQPHCHGSKLLWFGHGSNYGSLQRVLPDLENYELHIVSNVPGTRRWSLETMVEEFAVADIVILPATEPWKSPNRAVEAIRQGCFVVAEPHPALEAIPGIWIGNIKEGVEWASSHWEEANQRSLQAQKYVTENLSPKIVGSAWRKLIPSRTTSDVEKLAGMVGSASI